MSLAIFDLDNTLLNGDSDYLWGKYLVDAGLVDGDVYEKENQRFYQEYNSGQLDILEFLAFSLKPLSQHSKAKLDALHEDYMATIIRPIITPASRTLLKQHRDAGDTLLIITATNRFITGPIATELGVEHLIATDAEIVDGRYTGRISGTPCFQQGKVTRLHAWLKQSGNNLSNSCFYSDSHNDLPLLELVTTPIAVNPDETLADHARAKDWRMLNLRGDEIENIQVG